MCRIQNSKKAPNAREMHWMLKTYHIRNRWVGCRNFFLHFVIIIMEEHMWIYVSVPISFRYWAFTVHIAHVIVHVFSVQLRKLVNEICCKNVPEIRSKSMFLSNLCHIPYSIHNLSEIFQDDIRIEWKWLSHSD